METEEWERVFQRTRNSKLANHDVKLNFVESINQWQSHLSSHVCKTYYYLWRCTYANVFVTWWNESHPPLHDAENIQEACFVKSATRWHRIRQTRAKTWTKRESTGIFGGSILSTCPAALMSTYHMFIKAHPRFCRRNMCSHNIESSSINVEVPGASFKRTVL